MLNLSELITPTQSNGKVEFINLSAVKPKLERKKKDSYDLMYNCEINKNNGKKKHHFTIDKAYLTNHKEQSFCLVGAIEIEGELNAYLIQSLDGNYGLSKNIMRVWKGVKPFTKITSEAIFTILEKCNVLADNAISANFKLTEVAADLEGCIVYEITPNNISTNVEAPVAEETVFQEVIAEEVDSEQSISEQVIMQTQYSFIIA